MITGYLVGMVALMGLWAIRSPNETVRNVFVLGAMWPVTILLVLGTIGMNLAGWQWNVAAGKMFGFRRPTNPNARGFAVSLFNTEIQFYKA
jgi:hypothetical protein